MFSWNNFHAAVLNSCGLCDSDGPPPLVSDDEFDCDSDRPPLLVSDENESDYNSIDFAPDTESDDEDVTALTINYLAERRSFINARQLQEADKAWKFVQNANVGQADAVEMVMR